MTNSDKTELLNYLSNHFGSTDLRQYCMQNGPRYDFLSGENLRDKFISLIDHLERKNQFHLLRDYLQEHRGTTNWQKINWENLIQRQSQGISEEITSERHDNEQELITHRNRIIFSSLLLLFFSILSLAFFLTKPSYIKGQIVDSGQPIEGVKISLKTKPFSDDPIGITRTDKDGFFRICVIPGRCIDEKLNVDTFYLDIESAPMHNQPIIKHSIEIKNPKGYIVDIDQYQWIDESLELTTPTNGIILNSSKVSFEWDVEPNAFRYEVEIYEFPVDAPPVKSISIEGQTEVDIDLPLGEYFWLVKAINKNEHIYSLSTSSNQQGVFSIE